MQVSAGNKFRQFVVQATSSVMMHIDGHQKAVPTLVDANRYLCILAARVLPKVVKHL